MAPKTRTEALQKYPKTSERTNLQPWQRIALTRHFLYGTTYQDVVDEMRGGRGKDTLRQLSRSPAGKDLQAEIEALVGDTPSIVKMMLEASALEVYSDWWVAFKAAVAAGDYRAVHTMAKEVGLKQILADDKAAEGPKTITINLVGAASATGTAPIKTDYKVLEVDHEEVGDGDTDAS